MFSTYCILYRKVYLAIREHYVNECQLVNVLMKVRLESKVAKTFWLADRCVDILLYPSNSFYYLTLVCDMFFQPLAQMVN